MLLIGQFKSPIILILLAATILSLFLHNFVDASVILSIVLISGLLGFWQEHSASNAVAKLLALVQIKAAVLRDGKPVEIPVEDIVLVIRSRKPFFRSKPGKYLLIATLTIAFITLILPFTPLGTVFGFSPLSATTYLLLLLIVVIYIIAAEITKTIFYKKVKF